LNLQEFEYIQKIEKKSTANGPNPLAAQLVAFLHSVGTTRLAQRTWPTTALIAAHGCPARRPTTVRRDWARHALSGTACKLDGGVHARQCGDFTDAGEWLATRSERWCSTRTERWPRRQCLPARCQTGWRHGRGRWRAPAQLSATQRLGDLRGGQRG
jgi:hypothetical protein